jgi:hypothetical protein
MIGVDTAPDDRRRRLLSLPDKGSKAWTFADGPLFQPVNKSARVLPDRLNAQSMALMVEAYAERTGSDPKVIAVQDWPRAAERTFTLLDVRRYRSVDILRGHGRDAEIFRGHVGAGLLEALPAWRFSLGVAPSN